MDDDILTPLASIGVLLPRLPLKDVLLLRNCSRFLYKQYLFSLPPSLWFLSIPCTYMLPLGHLPSHTVIVRTEKVEEKSDWYLFGGEEEEQEEEEEG
eukprot:Phypoly_transcript_28115.p2 GENE.Phypoly_transcript_28115~~Phypoly_transcript_28115.p2  ORF type:complete len:112 (+),score=22.80 Phypoly_transcript_28115:48-338(+)